MHGNSKAVLGSFGWGGNNYLSGIIRAQERNCIKKSPLFARFLPLLQFNCLSISSSVLRGACGEWKLKLWQNSWAAPKKHSQWALKRGRRGVRVQAECNMMEEQANWYSWAGESAWLRYPVCVTEQCIKKAKNKSDVGCILQIRIYILNSQEVSSGDAPRKEDHHSLAFGNTIIYIMWNSLLICYSIYPCLVSFWSAFPNHYSFHVSIWCFHIFHPPLLSLSNGLIRWHYLISQSKGTFHGC